MALKERQDQKHADFCIMMSMAESSTKPRRRWFRFSLRSLLLIVAIIGVALGWKVNQVRHQQAVVAELVQAGMELEFDVTNAIYATSSQGTPAKTWLRTTLGDEFFTQLTNIVVPPRAGLSKVTDDDLKLIASLPYLKNLTIERERASGDGLAHLAMLSTLRFFGCGDVTDADASHIAKIRQLEALNLHGSPITDHGLASLVSLSRLVVLQIPETNISDLGLESIAKLRNLKGIDLNTTQITDAGLKYLQMMPRLEEIHLDETRVTADGVDKLRKALPLCNVYWTKPATGPKRSEFRPATSP